MLFSSNAIDSEWVKHEGSMACAFQHRIIPVNIEPTPTYSMGKLPIWAKPIHLLELYVGSPEYADQLEKLKEKLDRPLSVQKYLLDQIGHYERDGTLLDEVGLALVTKHFDKLHLKAGEKKIALKLIEETRRKFDDYRITLEKLIEIRENAERVIQKLTRQLNWFHIKIAIAVILYFLILAYAVFVLGFALVNFY